MVKSFVKSKSEPNAAGPKFRTPDHFRAAQASKGSIFGPGKQPQNLAKGQKFSNASFRTQHKG